MQLNELNSLARAVDVARNTMSGIYPDVMNTNPSYRTILSSYTHCFRQVETIFNETSTSLSLYRPLVKKPTEGADHIPSLLSTMLGLDEKESKIVRDPSATNGPEELEAIEDYNGLLAEIEESYDVLVAEYSKGGGGGGGAKCASSLPPSKRRKVFKMEEIETILAPFSKS